MTNQDTLAGGVKLEAEVKRAIKALAPFASRVFNDNGDLTVNTAAFVGNEIEAAYFAHRALSQALAALPATGAVKAEPRSEAELEALPAHPLAKWRGGLDLGIHRVFWKVGGSSLVAIGMSTDGRRWFAPCNWVAPSTDPEAYFWDDIERTELLHAYPDRAPSGGGHSVSSSAQDDSQTLLPIVTETQASGGEPEPVAVAWRWPNGNGTWWVTNSPEAIAALPDSIKAEPLFASPPKPSEAPSNLQNMQSAIPSEAQVEAALKAFIKSVREQDSEWTDDIDEGEVLLTSPSGDYFAPYYPLLAALTAALSSGAK